MVTVIQCRHGLGGATVWVVALVVALVMGGEGWELMDTMAGKFQRGKGGKKCLMDMVEDLEGEEGDSVLEVALLPGLMLA
jgi:hypothetical protein